MTEPTEQRPRARCLICGKPQEDRWRPFCSKRCADIDLGRWLGERYRIAAFDDGQGEDGQGEDSGGDTAAGDETDR
jgi:uncharacterized protein